MRFDCFGTTCGVWGERAADARAQLEAWHTQFTRFAPTSELSRLNADPRATVPVSPTMAKLLKAIADAARHTGGLVDGTLTGELEDAGYTGELRCRLPLDVALTLAPPRAPARGRPTSAFTLLRVGEAHLVRRPPGLRFDSGGLAKGLFADLLAERMHGAFAVDCGGDLRFGGAPRALEVADPFGGPPLHTFHVRDGAAATSGIGRRSWLDAQGRPAHHLLDPATGRPAFTGVVQATALAPTALEAEWRAKAAVLSADPAWLSPHGGVLALDDGSHHTHHPQGARRFGH
jgi:thiamine biosynthesis lipoprotein